MIDPSQRIRTSEILQNILNECGDGHITLHDFTALMGDRAFALVILIFSLPNSLPIPGIPGFSTITGLPIMFIGFQMLLGQDMIWLPKWLAKKEFSITTLKKVLNKAIPMVIKIERFLKPRWSFVLSPIGERLVGLCIVLMTCILILPIPGGNFLPGLSITILALSFLEKDGLVTLAGISFALSSLLVMLEIIKLLFTKSILWLNKRF